MKATAQMSRPLRRMFTARRSEPLRRQLGQALPLGLAFILVGMLGAFVLFNTGQVAVDKQRLANASDSAAYSGMVWQARALNFQAYTNRAMVANQVSIGQAVSLHSWADYADQFGFNAERVLGNIPYIGAFVRIMARVIEIIANIARPISQGIVSAVGPINKAVGTAQEVMYASSFAATPDIVRNVAKASDARFTADTAYSALGLTQSMAGWRDFTQEYSETDENLINMAERTKVINESRDDFTKERYWDFFDSFWVYTTPFTKHKVFREGESRLVMIQDGGTPSWEWMAKDTVAFHTRIYRGPWRSTKKIEVPMGWGAAYANSDDSGSKVLARCRGWTAQYDPDCRYRHRNRKTEGLANADISQMNNYTGVNAFRSISESARNPVDGEAVLRLKTEVSMDIAQVASSDRFISNREPFVTPMVSPADKLSSISVAEVYYRRPEAYRAGVSATLRMEAANGYNPYWDVRLAAIDATDRLAALGMRGDLGGGSTLPGGVAAEALANYEPPESEDETGAEGGDDGSGDPAALPSYEGATLASVMGVSDAQVNALVASAPADFVAASIEEYIGVDDFVEEIKSTVKEEVKQAAENFLTGAFTSFVEDRAPGVVNTVQQADALAQEAMALADDLSQKFETMRTEVQREFEEELVTRIGEYEAAIEPVRDEIARLQGEYATARQNYERAISVYGEDYEYVAGRHPRIDALRQERTRLAGELADFRDQATTLSDDLRNGLTTYLIDRIEYHGRGLLDERMPWPEMNHITNFLIDDYLTTPEDERGEVDVNELLPWGEDEDV